MNPQIAKFFILGFTIISFLKSPVFAQNQSPESRKNVLILRHENDALNLRSVTDEFYSFGLIAGYRHLLEKESRLSSWLRPKNLKQDFLTTISAEVFLKGYTPEFSINEEKKDIRPFAGILAGQFEVENISEKRLLGTGILLGLRGPASGAEWVQDNFHKLIGSPIFEGWENQLPNKFLFGGTFQFYKPLLKARWVDLILESDLSAGNYLSFLQQGARIRVGKFNPIHRTALYSNQFYSPSDKSNFEFFITARYFGRLALVDATLSKESEGAVDVSQINKSNLMAGYEVALYGQWKRLGVHLARTRFSSDSNFSVKHSFGTIGFSFLI
jgi:hypothetical protein